MSAATSRSAVPAWFDPSGPVLIGAACTTCHTVVFPPTVDFCRNPACDGEDFVNSALSTSGTVWSYTVNHYKPPAPYVSPDPFVPYAVLAVELAAEQMVVLGQLSLRSAPVAVGDRVRLVSETLLVDDEGEQMVWRWTGEGES